MAEAWVLYAVVGALAGVLGLLVGRRSAGSAGRIRELETELEGRRKQEEHARAELQAAKEQLQKTRGEIQDYRSHVVEHFEGASDLLRDLTFQYRSVFEHMREGAHKLCPETEISLDAAIPAPAIAAESGEAAGDAPDLEVDDADLGPDERPDLEADLEQAVEAEEETINQPRVG